MKGSFTMLLLTRLVPLLIACGATFVGWLNTFPIPEGTLFTMVYPLTKGLLPTVWSGGYRDCPVARLPEEDNGVDVTIQPRPYKETFIRLPGSGDRIPQQGIGMCCRYTAYDAESVRRTVLWYLKLGGRHIDTADFYQNHEWIGQALQIGMQRYQIPRHEIWVTTKLWPRYYGRNATLAAIPRMLQELQLDYIDLLLMHAPSDQNTNQLVPSVPSWGSAAARKHQTECAQQGLSHKECRRETWEALAVARNHEGWVRNVGVSNFNVRQLQELQRLQHTTSTAPIANNQFQYNPWVPDHVHETFEYCRKQGIPVTAWSSFDGGAAMHLRHMETFTVDTLRDTIAQQHNVTVAQVLLKWAMQKGAIVIPGTGNPRHMQENLATFDMEPLSQQEMAAMDDLKRDESAQGFFLASMVDDT